MAFTPGMDQQLRVRVESDGAEAFAGRMDRATNGLMDFKKAAAAAGAAVAALGTKAMADSINAARNFESAIVELEKVANEDVASEMSDSIQEMAEEIPRTQSELAGLATDAARFGIEGTKNIENFTRTVSKMATATDLEANQAGEALAKLAELTDTPIEKVEQLGSAINTMGNEFATSQSEVVDSLLRSSAALQSLGLQQTEMIGVAAALNEVSESSRRAGTRLRRLAQEVMDPGKAEEFADALGLSLQEFQQMQEENPTQLILEMAQAFAEGGEQADALRSTLSTQTQQALAGLSNNLDGLEEAIGRSNEEFERGESIQEEFESQLDTTDSQIELTRNKLRNLAIDTGEVFLPYVNQALERINVWIDAFSRLNKETDGMAGALTSFGAVLGGVAAVALYFSTGPVALVATALAGLAGVWFANVGGIQDKTVEAFGVIEQQFRTAARLMKGPLTRAAERGRTEFEKMQGPIRIFGNVLRTNLQFYVDIFRRTFRVIGRVVQRALDFLVNDMVMKNLQRLNRLWKIHGQGLISESVETFAVLSRHFRRFVHGVIIPVIRFGLRIIGKIWAKWGDEIKAIVDFAFDFISVTIINTMDLLLATIRAGLALIRGDWGEAWDIMVSAFKRSFGRALEFVKHWGGELIDYITGLAKDIGGSIKSAINDALGLPFSHSIGSVSVGGETVFSGETVGIPALAEGGIVERQTLAMIGEAGPEAVVPLDKMGQMTGPGGQEDINVSVRFDIDPNNPLAEFVEESAEVVVDRELAARSRRLDRLGSRGERR